MTGMPRPLIDRAAIEAEIDRVKSSLHLDYVSVIRKLLLSLKQGIFGVPDFFSEE
jgi:hypothetical protein